MNASTLCLVDYKKGHTTVSHAKFLSDAVTEPYWEWVLADGITIQIKKNKLMNSYIFPCHSNAKGFFNIMFKVWSDCPHKYH